MAHNNNSRKSVGLCHKIRNAVSPFGSRIRRQPPATRPVQNLHQSSSISKSIPVEFNHIKKLQNKTGREFGEREIVIVRGQRKNGEDKTGTYANGRSNEDDESSIHEGKFSDYINKVKSRMLKTASNVGGGVDRSFSVK